jgi:predicted kinase
MLIAMAGLPGTGKSTLAALLANELNGVVLSKDVVRAAMFPAPVLDYSSVQDDAAMQAVFSATRLLLSQDASLVVILDGRTFRKAEQVAALLVLGREVGQEPIVIEFICDEEVARARLEHDAAEGNHLAGNRNGSLYAAVKSTAVPIAIPRLVLDTGRESLEECLTQACAYIRQRTK